MPLKHSLFLVYECLQTNSCLLSSVHKLGSWISLVISLTSSIFCPLRIWQGCIQPGSLCGGTMGILMQLIYKLISRALTLLWFLARYACIWQSTLLKCKKMTLAIGVCMTTLHMVIGSNDARHTLVATHHQPRKNLVYNISATISVQFSAFSLLPSRSPQQPHLSLIWEKEQFTKNQGTFSKTTYLLWTAGECGFGCSTYSVETHQWIGIHWHCRTCTCCVTWKLCQVLPTTDVVGFRKCYVLNWYWHEDQLSLSVILAITKVNDVNVLKSNHGMITYK